VLYYQPQMDSGRLSWRGGSLALESSTTGHRISRRVHSLWLKRQGLILSIGKLGVGMRLHADRFVGNLTRRRHISTVSVNISVRQMRDPSFVEQVLTTLERTGANPRHLRLELTESYVRGQL
jgi:EAL domain-containing protein (putative c-di-GMP-specific phosphodiesterase class I)